MPSPKVATYDLQPEMSAPEVTDKLVDAIRSEKFDLIVVNYANGDMVGHTGDFDAAAPGGRDRGYLPGPAGRSAAGCGRDHADHRRSRQCGRNVRRRYRPAPYGAHFIIGAGHLVNPPDDVQSISDGVLADVAPTLLTMLQLPQPGAMTGRSLITLSADAAV